MIQQGRFHTSESWKNNWAPIFTGGSFHQKLFPNRVLVWFCTLSQKKIFVSKYNPPMPNPEKKNWVLTPQSGQMTQLWLPMLCHTLFWCDTILWHWDPVFFSGFGISGSYSFGGHLSYCDHLQNQINTHCVQSLVKWPRSKAWWERKVLRKSSIPVTRGTTKCMFNTVLLSISCKLREGLLET